MTYIPTRGVNIAFTGIDGAGKSTQAGLLARFLRDNYGPSYFFESKTDIVSQLTLAIAWGHNQRERREYFGNYAFDLAKSFDVLRDHFETAAPLLAAGMHVVSPRSVYCRLALSIAFSANRDQRIVQVLSLVPKPDLVFWLDVDPLEAQARIEARGIDLEGLEYLQQFHHALHELPESSEWIRIDGNQCQAVISDEIQNSVQQKFSSLR